MDLVAPISQEVVHRT